jgi:sugar phosphate isomerase/epimerase
VKLSCQEHLLPGDSILEKWEFATTAGFDGIELRGTCDWRERLDDLRTARDRDVVFSSVCLIDDRFIGDFDIERRHEAVEHMKVLLSGIAELGGAGAITPAAYGLASKRLPPFEIPRTEEEDRRVLLDALEELGELADTEGVLVLLEPLNRYEDHMLNRLEGAVELSKAAGRDSVKVMGDLFHMNIEEDDPAGSIRRAGGIWLMSISPTATAPIRGLVTTTSPRPSGRCATSGSMATWPWSAPLEETQRRCSRRSCGPYGR